MKVLRIVKIETNECEHVFTAKGDIGYAVLECVKCGYWEVL